MLQSPDVVHYWSINSNFYLSIKHATNPSVSQSVTKGIVPVHRWGYFHDRKGQAFLYKYSNRHFWTYTELEYACFFLAENDKTSLGKVQGKRKQDADGRPEPLEEATRCSTPCFALGPLGCWLGLRLRGKPIPRRMHGDRPRGQSQAHSPQRDGDEDMHGWLVMINRQTS